MLAALCAACVHAPDRAQLEARGMARIQVESLARWNLSVPGGNGYDVQIAHLDGKSLCRGGGCVGSLDLLAGRHSLSLLCMLVTGGLRIPQGSADYQGDFAAGRVYGIKPLAVGRDCRMGVEDISAQAP